MELGYRNGIFSTRVPGVTTRDSANREPDAISGTMLLNSLLGIVGTGGMKTAIASQKRAENITVNRY